MNEFIYSRVIGIILGILMLMVVAGAGFLFFIGTSLGRALNGSIDSTGDPVILVIFAILLISAIITFIGAFGLKKKAWRIFYMGYSLVVGFCFLFGYFLSIGALGIKFEGLILVVGLLYLLLAYLIRTEK